MKKTLLFLLLLLPVLASAQTDKLRAGIATFSGFAVSGAAEYTGDVSGFLDVWATNYRADSIAVNDLIIDATGHQYRVDFVNSATPTTASIVVISLQTPHKTPVGRGVIWEPIGSNLMPPAPWNNLEITPYLRSLIDGHNIEQLKAAAGVNVNQITVLGDTASYTVPNEGDVLIKSDSTLAAFYNGTQWLVLTGGAGGGGGADDWGSQVVQSDATLTGDGTAGNLLGVNTSTIATNAYADQAEQDAKDYADANDADTQLTQEQVEDFTGGMVTASDDGLTYDDPGGALLADTAFIATSTALQDTAAAIRTDFPVGTTNLGYTASPTDGTVTSDTGTDATLPAADATNAGLLLPADFTKLGNAPTGSGTANRTALWTATNTLGDSYFLQDAAGLTIDAGKYLGIGIWTTAGRPAGAASRLGWNSTILAPEIHNGTEYKQLAYLSDINSTVGASLTANYIPVWNGTAFVDGGKAFLNTYKTILGNGAGAVSGTNYQVAIGSQAGASNSGNNQNAVGRLAGFSNSGNNQNVSGVSAGRSNAGDDQNAFGNNAGEQNTGNDQNTFGRFAGRFNSGNNQQAYGSFAGDNNSGVNQITFGPSSGRYNRGDNNISMGLESGTSVDSTFNGGDDNIWLGRLSGSVITTGSDNIGIGPNAGNGLRSGDGSIYLGAETTPSSSSVSNEIVLGISVTGSGSNTSTLGNSSITHHYFGGTGAIAPPSGTTAQRQTGAAGFFRYNSTWGGYDGHDGTAYVRFLTYPDATPTNGQGVIFQSGAWALASIPTEAEATLIGHDAPSIAAGATYDFTITVSGASVGDPATVAPSAVETGFMFSAWVSASNTVTVRLHNTTAGAVDPAVATWTAKVLQ